jgi:apyrase
VHDVPLDWALGALIVRLSEDRVEEQPPVVWVFHMILLKVLSILGFLGVGTLAIFFIVRFRRPQLTTIYDLEKGRYITTASRIR